MMWVRVTVLFLFIGLLASCSGSKGNDTRFGIDPSPTKKAAENVTDSFSVKNGELSISKSAYEKEFLLQTELIDSMMINAFSGMKSRVVYFIQRGQKVFMLESSVGQVLNNEYDPKLILASFDVKKEDSQSVTIDLNAGLSKLYVGEDWYTQDSDGAEFSRDTVVIRANQSYLDQLKIENQNLVIKQVVQAEGTPTKTQLMLNFATTYYLTPYNPDPKFEPKNNYSFDHFGYFETSPILKSGGESLVRAAKFNINKPIVYAVSANTPESFKQAVRDGVLYWNRIFGSNRVQVVDAPAGVTAPDFNYNLIQWVDWDDAGMAYADAQMDPRSGEVLHAQVFMTSTFAAYSKSSLRAALRKIKAHGNKQKQNVRLNGFEKGFDCDITSNEQMQANLEHMLSLNLSDDQILKLSQDYVRLIVAHEVGHTLGLRHNFAGTLSANYKSSEFDNIFEQYIKNDSTTAIPTSSVMDYMDVLEELMAGRHIRDGKSFEYDDKAIQHLYFNKNYDNKDVPLFCTDTQRRTYVDCQTFDTGNSFVDGIKTSVQSEITNAPAKILEQWVLWKTSISKEEQENFDIMKAIPPPSRYATRILRDQDLLSKMLKKSFKLLSVRRKYGYDSEVNQDEILHEQDTYIADEIQKAGGLASVLEPFTQNKDQFVKELSGKLTQLIDSGVYGNGVGDKEREFKITSQEFDQLKKISVTYFGKLFDELKKHQLKAWAKFLTDEVRDTPNAEMVADFLATEAKNVILSEKPKRIYTEVSVNLYDANQEPTGSTPINPPPPAVVKPGEKPAEKQPDPKPVSSDAITQKDLDQRYTVVIQVPDYVYSYEQRLLATNLLTVTDPSSSSIDAGAAVSTSTANVALAYQQKAHVKEVYKAVKKSFMWPLDGWHFKVEEQKPEAMKWLLEQQKVEAAL